MLRILAFALVSLFLIVPAARSGEVLVFAASSLTNAFQELAREFEQAHPETEVVCSFGASDVVLRQMIHGAPADIFAAADEQVMDIAVKAGVVDPGTRVDFAGNGLVLIAPRDSGKTFRSLEDLGQAARIAVGNPDTVPVGRYTRAALQARGLWDALQPRAIYTQNVRQALEYVARGEVDAGFVFASDAQLERDRVAVVEALDSPDPIRYPMALATRAQGRQEARDFLHFVRSPAGREVLQRYGFLDCATCRD